ncbi:terminase [Verminephrobacter aporrectodeae subsp. tuberculatae]|uniref:Terminase n=1 Tax=Verminephrobacter aporrectodeae subsp. tuberculatae TaxID=1110392 RepID=A0ABT3KQE7_9BURK|nr:phage terminase small subunit [Verminephrobacter aporrectodeae]MCW5320538.1 terminase [Verminephrobacter aporrectodeae subsp. tuberculatae]
MSTPARRHQMRVHAAQAVPAGGEVEGSMYELMQAQLYEHRRTLKGIQSIERKIEAKRAFLPVYDDWIDGALAGDNGAQDMVLVSVMVWHLDVGNWTRGLQIGAYALRHKMSLPDQYQRDIATLLIDESSTAALAGKMDGDEAVQTLGEVENLTRDLDAPDQARAKLHKAIGYALIGKTPSADPDFSTLDQEQATQAMDQLQRAQQLFDKVGVKKDMERLERRLKAAPGTD